MAKVAGDGCKFSAHRCHGHHRKSVPNDEWRLKGSPGPWKNLDQVEYATLKWVTWYNHRRVMIGLGGVPPVEYEQAHYNAPNGQAKVI